MATGSDADMAALKLKLKATWQSGDYGVFSKYLQKGALEFFDRLGIAAGTKMLDIAYGAGQLTLPAARRGIRVSGIDLAANLVAQAQEKARAEGLKIDVIEGDAESLPYEDATFDVVISLIGSMFAPRPDLVASEMLRVCRSGGRVIMGNWTPTGHVGQMFQVIARHIPPAPNMPSPLLWGDEEVCRSRLSKGLSLLHMARHQYPFEYDFPPARVVDFFNHYYGPTHRGVATLDPVARQALNEELTELWSRNNLATDGTTRVMAEYIEVNGLRA